MKVLVTGASGLIGAHVTQALLDQDAEPVACDTAPFVPPMGADSNRVPFVLADVSDLDALSSILETYQIDRIVHSAAILARTCQENPTLAVNVNVVGSLNVLEAARRLGVTRVVMASSIAVYGNTTSEPIDETHPLNPTTVYGSAKVLVEACGQAYRKNHGLEFVALRYGATYGPGSGEAYQHGSGHRSEVLFREGGAFRRSDPFGSGRSQAAPGVCQGRSSCYRFGLLSSGACPIVCF